MKIAIALSGQLRQLGQMKLPKVFARFNPTYFIHTWEHETNPNLRMVDKGYFPSESTEIKVEKYEDHFDHLKYSDVDVHIHRYRFAQFFTVMKSLQMVKDSNQEFDIIIRARTDMDLPMGQWNNVEEFQPMWNDLLMSIKNHHAHGCYDFDTVEGADWFRYPWIASSVTSIDHNYTVFADWFWIMNTSALNSLCSLTPEEAVNKAKQVKEKHTPIFKSEFDNSVNSDVLKSPTVWAKIFSDNKIPLINHHIGMAGIIRDLNYVRNSSYGDLS